MIKPLFSDLVADMDCCGEVYHFDRNIGAKQRLFVIAGTHGNEIAGAIALQKLSQEVVWLWPNVEVLGIMQDPAGYQDEGYGFVGVDGSEAVWPPLWGSRMNQERYWAYYDENSTWGNNVIIPKRHQIMRMLMDTFKPTFCLSLHETVRSETGVDPFWAGAGLLMIETWPISSAELAGVMDTIGNPLSDPVGWTLRTLREWLRGLVKMRRYRFARQAVMANPYYQMLTKIAERFEETGGKLTSDRWMRYQETIDALVLGAGRLLSGPERMRSEWRTVTDYALDRYGCPGVTTETFPTGTVGLRGVDDRVCFQRLFVEAVLDVLNENN